MVGHHSQKEMIMLLNTKQISIWSKQIRSKLPQKQLAHHSASNSFLRQLGYPSHRTSRSLAIPERLLDRQLARELPGRRPLVLACLTYIIDRFRRARWREEIGRFIRLCARTRKRDRWWELWWLCTISVGLFSAVGFPFRYYINSQKKRQHE